jgi:hypothetical protein
MIEEGGGRVADEGGWGFDADLEGGATVGVLAGVACTTGFAESGRPTVNFNRFPKEGFAVRGVLEIKGDACGVAKILDLSLALFSFSLIASGDATNVSSVGACVNNFFLVVIAAIAAKCENGVSSIDVTVTF